MIDALALLISHLMLVYCVYLILIAPDREENIPLKVRKWRPASFSHRSANRSESKQFRA